MFLAILPVIIASLALCAHFVRWSEPGLAVVCMFFPFLLVVARKWSVQVVRLFLSAGCGVWAYMGFAIVSQRLATGEPWFRAASIMGVVALLTAASTLPLRSLLSRSRYMHGSQTAGASTVAFALVFILCAFPQALMHDPIPLLLQRFVRSGGWIEIFALSIYAAGIAEKLLTVSSTGPVRRSIWITFSIVFFAQAIAGVAGAGRFLMTGALHLPVPAAIIAGPLYRGEGFFMPLLFGATVLFLGPAWCSWLCYFGSWDNHAAQLKVRPLPAPKRREAMRICILAATVLTALALKWAGAGTTMAASIGGAFGLVGIGIMAALSKRRGMMVHCTMYCPVGLLADIAGKLNPFRMKINAGCTDCGACGRACRYDALTLEDIRRRQPGITCALCGDCTTACNGHFIDYHFPGLNAASARRAFMVMAVVFHTVFLGFARI